MEGLFGCCFADNINDNGRNNNMGKLSNNEIFKRSRNISVFGLVFLLCFSIVFSKTIDEKIKDFDKLTDKDKQKEIYKECLESKLTTKGQVLLHGTDYNFNENATTFLQLQENGNAINNAKCFLNIYYPSKTLFKTNEPMIYLTNSSGIYYYDFVTPNITGVYIYEATCWYKVDNEIDKVVNDYKLLIGDLTGGTYSDTNFLDSVFHRHKEIETPAKLDLIYNISTINLPLLEGVIIINVTTSYRWTDNLENLQLYLFNYNDSTWKLLNTQLDYSTSTKTVMNYITFINNPKNYISNNIDGKMALRITDSDPTDSSIKEFYFDYLNIKISYSEGSVYQTEGSSEAHISNLNVIQNITGTINANITGVISANITGTIDSISSTKLIYAGGTEYLSNTTGQMVYQYIRVQSGNPIPINNANCTTTIWYPSGNIFVNESQMIYLSGSNGLYNYTFTVPSQQGIYKVQATCSDPPKIDYGASTFHVENTITNNQQTIYNFIQSMNTTLVNNQVYLKSKIDDIWQYVQDMIGKIGGLVIS